MKFGVDRVQTQEKAVEEFIHFDVLDTKVSGTFPRGGGEFMNNFWINSIKLKDRGKRAIVPGTGAGGGTDSFAGCFG